MNKREILDVVFIGFGLYLLVRFVNTLHSVMWHLAIRPEYPGVSYWDYFPIETIHAVLQGALGLTLLFGRGFLHLLLKNASEGPTLARDSGAPIPEKLAFWIRIVGLYFLVSALPSVLGYLIDRRFAQPGSFLFSQFVRQTISLAVGFVLIIKADATARYLLKPSESGSDGGVSQ